MKIIIKNNKINTYFIKDFKIFLSFCFFINLSNINGMFKFKPLLNLEIKIKNNGLGLKITKNKTNNSNNKTQNSKNSYNYALSNKTDQSKSNYNSSSNNNNHHHIHDNNQLNLNTNNQDIQDQKKIEYFFKTPEISIINTIKNNPKKTFAAMIILPSIASYIAYNIYNWYRKNNTKKIKFQNKTNKQKLFLTTNKKKEKEFKNK
jgi:hypothetical protein